MAASTPECTAQNPTSSNNIPTAPQTVTATAGCANASSYESHISPATSSSSSSSSTVSTYSPISVDDLIKMATGANISSSNENDTTNSSLNDFGLKSNSNPRETQHFSEIIPNLYLTSANHITDENISSFQITYIVNATRTVPLKRQVKSMRINILDSQYEKICNHFDTVSDFINDALKNNQKVVVHCISGISRSSTLIIAFLMKYKDMMLKDAFNLVRSKRWFIRPNTGFFQQLVDYEHKLYDINTVKMVYSEAAGTHVPDFILQDSSNYKFFYLCIKK
ncbi:Dual specificity protein phosphatase 14 [Tyrophagus putrescentiae]|nr:Dual specificity protein phosphatase 14 [Tyrophagus putrescentiae]